MSNSGASRTRERRTDGDTDERRSGAWYRSGTAKLPAHDGDVDGPPYVYDCVVDVRRRARRSGFWVSMEFRRARVLQYTPSAWRSARLEPEPPSAPSGDE